MRRVYTPEPLLQHPWLMLRAIARDVRAGRELAWRLFVRDVSAAYRQTMLGYAWAFLPPLVTAGTFIFLQSQGITNIQGAEVPFPAFALMGALLWQVFADALGSPSTSLSSAKAMLVKINFPREAVLMAGLCMVLFNAAIRLILIAAVVVFWRIPVGPTLAFLPLAILGLLSAGFALGLLVTPLAGLYGDAVRAIPIVAGFWMLLTPVVYPPQTHGIAGWLTTWNPVSPLIITARECLTGQSLSVLGPFFFVTAGSLLLILAGLVCFRIAMPHLIERMGS
jgi:lipopolysaccharide transport system permease protein